MIGEDESRVDGVTGRVLRGAGGTGEELAFSFEAVRPRLVWGIWGGRVRCRRAGLGKRSATEGEGALIYWFLACGGAGSVWPVVRPVGVWVQGFQKRKVRPSQW